MVAPFRAQGPRVYGNGTLNKGSQIKCLRGSVRSKYLGTVSHYISDVQISLCGRFVGKPTLRYPIA